MLSRKFVGTNLHDKNIAYSLRMSTQKILQSQRIRQNTTEVLTNTTFQTTHALTVTWISNIWHQLCIHYDNFLNICHVATLNIASTMTKQHMRINDAPSPWQHWSTNTCNDNTASATDSHWSTIHGFAFLSRLPSIYMHTIISWLTLTRPDHENHARPVMESIYQTQRFLCMIELISSSH